MDLPPLIEQVSKTIALLDESDLVSLQALRGQIIALKEGAEPAGLAGVADACDQGVGAVDALIRASAGEGDAPDEWRPLLNAIATYATDVLEALELGRPVEAIAPPSASPQPPAASEIDPEMMALFVGSTNDNLADLEEALLELEQAPSLAAESLPQVKRSLHTIKGECGVIPLPKAQALCHAAEDLVDRFTERGAVLPTQQLLQVCDWLGAYCTQLSEGDWQSVPACEALLAELEGAAPAAGPDAARIAFSAAVLEDEVLPDFIGEAREHIEASEAALLDLQHQPDNVELVNAIFRAFHTIKGVAGYLNLEPMVELAHTAETLMAQLRKGDTPCSKQHLDLIFASCDVMGGLLGALEGSEGPLVSAHRTLVDALKLEIENSSDGDPKVCEQAVESAADKRPENRRQLLQILVDQGLISNKVAETLLARQKKLRVHKVIGQIAVDTGIVTQADIDGALAIQASERAEPQPTLTPAAPLPAKAPSDAAKPANANQRKQRIASTIKVNTERLDSLVDLVGELVIAQQMVYQDPALDAVASERLARNLSQVAKITRDMHAAAMSLRMVTLTPTFQKMARLVRDVSVKAGKEVELVLMGEDTELDRNVVEEISDPMVHLIRNAIDHGLETPAERKAAGKPPTGRLELRASHQGGAIVIEIRDDGRGLSRDKILAKAAEKGLLPPDQDPAELPDSQVWELIFQAGFSTVAVVSDISGRGVGMDVVRRNIEKMRGKVEIASEAGQGAVFSLRLPLTLAIIDGMVVRVGDQRYVLPTLSIEQSFRPTAAQLHRVMNEGEVVEVREMLLPIHRLRDLFHQADGVVAPEEGILIVLEDNGERCCVMVDEIIGQQQVVIKSLGQACSALRGISGGAILGDGRIALIVDVDGLVSRVSQVSA